MLHSLCKQEEKKCNFSIKSRILQSVGLRYSARILLGKPKKCRTSLTTSWIHLYFCCSVPWPRVWKIGEMCRRKTMESTVLVCHLYVSYSRDLLCFMWTCIQGVSRDRALHMCFSHYHVMNWFADDHGRIFILPPRFAVRHVRTGLYPLTAGRSDWTHLSGKTAVSCVRHMCVTLLIARCIGQYSLNVVMFQVWHVSFSIQESIVDVGFVLTARVLGGRELHMDQCRSYGRRWHGWVSFLFSSQ